MTLFTFIRHPQSKKNLDEEKKYVCGRNDDAPITEKGFLETTQSGLYLKKNNIVFDLWVAGPSTRTRTSALILKDILSNKNELIIDPRVQELSQGEWEGKLKKDIFTDVQMNEIRRMNGHFKPPGGESIHDVIARNMDFVDEYSAKYPEQHIAVLSHSFSIRCLVGAINNFSTDAIRDLKIDNMSFSTLEVVNGHKKMRDINNIAHLKL